MRHDPDNLRWICTRCRKTLGSSTQRCPDDGLRAVRLDHFEAAGRDPLLGTTLAGRYTLLAGLGAGGMGTVYRAEQSPLGREVALKVLRRELGRDDETVARFRREAQLLSQLRHPNTVQIVDFGQTDDGLLYLAMELLEGEMLSARIKSGPLDVEESVRVAMGVLRSLDEAHARGIIHRDLKPDNIFLARVHARPDEAEMVKVVDFGIAKIRDGDRMQGLDPLATQEGTVFGTPRYMSPEQAQGKPIDGRSDLYAVGVLLFHMLTGAAPFTEDDAVVVMAHHIQTVPPPLREAAPGRPIPEALEALVERVLEKDPANRPQSAQDFLTALEGILPDIREARTSGVLIGESAVTGGRSSQRKPAGGLVLGIGLVLAAVAIPSVLMYRAKAVNDASGERATAPARSASSSPLAAAREVPTARGDEGAPGAPAPAGAATPTAAGDAGGMAPAANPAARYGPRRRVALPTVPEVIVVPVATPVVTPTAPPQRYPRWTD